MDKKLLRLKQVIECVPFGKSKVWEMSSAGEFPQPIKIGRSTFWIESEVTEWVEKQISDFRGVAEEEPAIEPKAKTVKRSRRVLAKKSEE